MNKLSMLSQICVALLMLDAGAVFLGLAKGWNMWGWIVGYWAILTIKNYIDYIRGLHDHDRNQ